VFLNLFFDAEPLAAILIAQGTRGGSQEFVLGELEAEGREPGRGSWGGAVFQQSPDHKYILDLLTA